MSELSINQSQKVRISKSGKIKKLLPSNVVKRVIEQGKEFGVNSATIKQVSQSHNFTVSEGCTYLGIHPNGESAEFEAVSANNIGTSGLSNKIGQVFNMPSGSYLIEVGYYRKYWMYVYCIEEV